MNIVEFKSLVKNVDTHLFELVNNLICSICQELFNKPVTTPCGHSFCSGCIRRVLSSKDNTGCPLCKNPVKRYYLEDDKVKLTLSEICKDLPAAFEKDVKDLSKDTGIGEDLLRTSKLGQLYNQEYVKDKKSRRRKTIRKFPKEEAEGNERDSESLTPVLKRSKRVLEYASAKKKRLDDLVSISQTDPASNSSFCGSSELEKKLEKIEKLRPEEKVTEWFHAVGDNIYINSPNSSITEFPVEKNESGGEKKETTNPTMIRVDYNKESRSNTNVDPYEFIPSQNKSFKRKRQRKTVKKIPDFKALQSFTKESLKRNTILLNENKEEEIEQVECRSPKIQNVITASQKFDQLLCEAKEKEVKTPPVTHVLYSASQASSPRFLDCSFHSKIEMEKKKTSKKEKKLLSSDEDESVLFLESKVGLFKDCNTSSGEKKTRSKRRRSLDPVKSTKKKKFSEIIEGGRDETPGLRAGDKQTLLVKLLKELLEDKIIYSNRSENDVVRLPEMDTSSRRGFVTQSTELLGFGTQEECPKEKGFKLMVEKMEKELNSSELSLMEIQPIPKSNKIEKGSPTPPTGIHHSKGSHTVDDKTSSSNNRLIAFNLLGRISKNKTSTIDFLHLGRLTPNVRRRSSVVKVVFPVGLSSCARRRALQPKVAVGVQTSQLELENVPQVSAGIQTSQVTASVTVQTSQILQSSATIQTTQSVGPSVEVQTTQRWTSSAGIQTTQIGFSEGIQTTQELRPSVEVQTTQRWTSSAGIQTTQVGSPVAIQTTQEAEPAPEVQTTPKWTSSAGIQTTSPEVQSAQIQTTLREERLQLETPLRKPVNRHRKVIRGENSPVHLFSPEEKKNSQKDLIANFDMEKEFERTWEKNSQTQHDYLVELKNEKNKNHNEKLLNKLDEDSDDSDIQPPKRMKNSRRILSQDSDPVDILEKYETRQMVPLNVRKVDEEEEMEVIDLGSPKSQNSEEQMNRVLKNIDLDLIRSKKKNEVEEMGPKGEKSEESDSDLFVEQTPPRLISDSRNLSRIRRPTPKKEQEAKENSEGPDLIGDSIPKGFSESFLLLSAPEKASLTPIKSSRPPPRFDFTLEKANENDQNQLNAKNKEKGRKTAQLKAAVEAWKRSESPKTPRKGCVVASGVKNQEMIKKFVSKFKMEYSNKPTKDLTHLIVGLHENDDGEVLPLCTPKLLFAMANKKWVVSELWAETSLKMNTLLPEEQFETLDPVGGNGCRKARLSSDRVLKNCEIYLLGTLQMISKEEFADLIVDCGGTLVSGPDKFSFLPSRIRMIIADQDCLKLDEEQLEDLHRKYSTVILSRDFIIMSIQSYNLANFSPYLLHQASEESLVRLGYPSMLVRNKEEGEEAIEE